jgi:hypothetical protein
MTTITYDSKKNSLIISDNGKPMQGVLGPMSADAYRKILINLMNHYQDNANALEDWLYKPKNIKHTAWCERKRLLNNFLIKIDTIERKLSGNLCTQDVPETISIPKTYKR